MHLDLIRFHFTEKATHGLLFQDGKFACYTLEDTYRGDDPADKIMGKTAIPMSLKYEVRLRKADSPLTEKYRSRFPWFEHHLHIQEVPGFEWIYIHPGNTPYHTDGCILIGDGIENSKLRQSTQAFERLYPIWYAAAKADALSIRVKQYFEWDLVVPTLA